MRIFLFVAGVSLLLLALYAFYRWARAWRDEHTRGWK